MDSNIDNILVIVLCPVQPSIHTRKYIFGRILRSAHYLMFECISFCLVQKGIKRCCGQHIRHIFWEVMSIILQLLSSKIYEILNFLITMFPLQDVLP